MNTIEDIKKELSSMESKLMGHLECLRILIYTLEMQSQSKTLSAEHKPSERPAEYVRQPTKGSAAYRLKLGGLSWMNIAKQLGITAANSCRLARCHAKSNSLPWPIKQAGGD